MSNLASDTCSYAGKYALFLRPNVGSDDHLLSIYEGPWSPDRKTWYTARICFVQERSAGAALQGTEVELSSSDNTESSHETARSQSHGPELAVMLKPEGAQQKNTRLEKESREHMSGEDEISKKMLRAAVQLEHEKVARERASMDARARSALIAAVATEQVTSDLGSIPKQSTRRFL